MDFKKKKKKHMLTEKTYVMWK